MSKSKPSVAGGSIEECLEVMDESLASLARFPDMLIAHALQVHLAALLRVLLESGRCTPDQAREFIADLEREAL